MSAPLDPIPQSDPLIDSTQHMNERWYRWLSAFVAQQGSGVLTVGKTAHRVGINAAIGATTVFTPTIAGLIYRVSYRARITTPAGVSSSLTVSVNWTEGGVACTKTFAALTGNTTATVDGDGVLIRPDTAVVTYSTAYASNPASAMIYDLDVTVEDLT
jgi:hypothetical protein